jgi:hypothetical protein
MKTISFLRNTTGLLVGLLLVASCGKETLPLNPEKPVSFKNGNLIPVSILLDGTSSGSTNSGTFSASGAIGSTGTWVEDYSWNGNKYHSKIEFTDSNGSFELYVHGQFTFSNATDGSGIGTWKVKKCTGAYVGMDGEGTNTLIISNFNGVSGIISQSLLGDVDY